MTLPHEELRALIGAREFLLSLMEDSRGEFTSEFRNRVYYVIKHYPFPDDIRDQWEARIKQHEKDFGYSMHPRPDGFGYDIRRP
jgi:hypothetical protein